MTRKEEISQAYTKYAQEGGILQSNPWFAFEAGAKWSDNHPKFIWNSPEEELDYLIKNHFDYRGLIEKGLALDATRLNIY